MRVGSMRPSRRSLVPALAALLLVIGVTSAPPAAATVAGRHRHRHRRPRRPATTAVHDRQPAARADHRRRSYRPPCSRARTSTPRTSSRCPPQWNGDLVMWAHGYRGNGTVLTVSPPDFGLRQRLLDQGYAWAASSYAGNGYDIRTGVQSTRSLADLFGGVVDRPHRTYIAGVSMGGHVIGRSLEQYPGFYEGALPLCGVHGRPGTVRLLPRLQPHRPGAGRRAGLSDPDRLRGHRGAADQYGAGHRRHLACSPRSRPTTSAGSSGPSRSTGPAGNGPAPTAAFAFWKNFLFSLAQPAVEPTPEDPTALRPGQIATNLLTRYQPNQPVDVNRTVQRVVPEDLRERLSPSLTQIPKIFGRPGVPVLSLHGLGDLFVTFSMEQHYAVDVALQRAEPPAGAAGDPHHQPLRVQPGRGRRRLGRPGALGRGPGPARR